MKRATTSFWGLLLLCAGTPAGANTGHPAAKRVEQTLHPSPTMIADALYCMEAKDSPAKSRPAEQRMAYQVRYVYGVVDPNVDKPNELHLISYDADGASAWLYELLVDARNGGGYALTWVNTARLQRKKGQWVIEDTLGGIYSYQRVQKLVERISREHEMSISLQSAKPSDLVCKSH